MTVLNIDYILINYIRTLLIFSNSIFILIYQNFKFGIGNSEKLDLTFELFFNCKYAAMAIIAPLSVQNLIEGKKNSHS